MSIASRQRNPKRPTTSSRDPIVEGKPARIPGPDKGLIPFKAVGLINARTVKTRGAFGDNKAVREAKIAAKAATAATGVTAIHESTFV
jgi:hypothetical protein